VFRRVFMMVKIEVKCAQLNDKNWGTWAPRVKMVLTLEGYLGLVTEGLGNAPTPAEVLHDAKAKAVIGAHLSDNHLATFIASRSAKHLWDTLEDRFNQSNHTRRLTLRRELTSMKKQQTETISLYFARAQQLRDDLQGADQNVAEDEVVCAVLSGLPRQYDVAVAIMEQSDRALTLDDCLNKLLVVEHKLGKDIDEPSAFVSKAVYRQLGAQNGGSGSNRYGSHEQRICWHCGQTGHIKPNCYKFKAACKEQQDARANFAFAPAH
jgi:hypothetical protein